MDNSEHQTHLELIKMDYPATVMTPEMYLVQLEIRWLHLIVLNRSFKILMSTNIIARRHQIEMELTWHL